MMMNVTLASLSFQSLSLSISLLILLQSPPPLTHFLSRRLYCQFL